MAQLPSLSGPVTMKPASAKIIPLNPGLAKEVAKAQSEDLKARRDQATSDHGQHNKFSDVHTELIDHMHTCMRQAVQFKSTTGITSRLARNIAQLEGRYDSRELQLMGGKETALWFNLTERTARTFIAFLRKTLAGVEVDFPQYDLKPTRVPDPPPDMLQRAENAVLDFIQLTIASGEQLNEDEIQNILSELADSMYENVREELLKTLRRSKRETDDVLQKMKWAEIVDDLIHDLVIHGTCILHGPYPEIVKRQYYTDTDIKVRHEKCMGAKRVDPNRIYPSPCSKDTQDGAYMIFHDVITRGQLVEARSIGNGWIDEAICTVLEEFNTTSRYWCASSYFSTTFNNTEENIINFNHKSSTWGHNEEIDIIKYFGKVPAKILMDHGIKEFDGRKIDTKESLEVEIFWIGNSIVKINCNIDPKCERPFQKSTLFNVPGRFWGRGAPETIEPQQKLANSFVRAIASNVGFTSKPIFEYDKALVRPQGDNRRYSDDIFPGKLIEKNSQITGLSGQALHIHQIDSRIAEFSNGINIQVELAEHILGIPRFLTGAHSGGGAARTFSGLQQLTENAAIQIRSSIINFDFNTVKPFITRVHRWVVKDRDNPLLYSDVEIITQGASAMLAREVHKDRLTALIGLLMPFAQSGVVTPQGMSYILAELIRDHGLDPAEVLADDLELNRFADIIRRNMAGTNFNGGQASAALPGGTLAQAGGGAPQIDPLAALAATGQLPAGSPLGLPTGVAGGGVQLPQGAVGIPTQAIAA